MMEDNRIMESSKIEKVDLTAIDHEREMEEFFEYTNKLLNDSYFLQQCEKYIKLKEEENDKQ